MNNPADIATAWKAQSESLQEVQIKGGRLEKKVQEILNWSTGRVVYDSEFSYDLQIDNYYEQGGKIATVASVTYTEPDTKGHSNENKLQLKLGELALLKYAYPECSVALILGGSRDSWLPYVLDAFEYFFDEVICLWTDEGMQRLVELKSKPESVTRKHQHFWSSLRGEWKLLERYSHDVKPPVGLLRYKIVDKIKNQLPLVDHPELVASRIAALCLNRSKRKGGAEWTNFLQRRWNALEQSRSYFNPVEALVELALDEAKIDFKGGVAHDIAVPSFLHELGMKNTLLSEDFIAFSEKYKLPVYIQCKASGGGRLQHGKNIQNRTKEQISRGILYRSTLIDNNLTLGEKKFIWVSILDGDWGVTKKYPLKYLHMLQFAGYDKYFGSEELVDNDLEPLSTETNPLINYLLNDLKVRLIK